MRCRIVNVVMDMMLDVQRKGQSKNDRWNENWKEISRRHPELDEQEDIAIESGRFTLLLEQVGLWAEVVYGRFEEMVDMHDVMQIEMMLTAAYLIGRDETSSAMFSSLIEHSEDEGEDDSAGPD